MSVKPNPKPGKQTSKAVASKAAKAMRAVLKFEAELPGIKSALASALGQKE